MVLSEDRNPQVVIIILTMNQKSDTLRCLKSLAQIDFPSYTVIIVDNGSSDGTKEAVSVAFPDTHILSNTTNLGVATGRNVGIRYANKHFSYAYLLFLDNDTVVEKDFLTSLVRGIESDPDPSLGIAFPKIYHMLKPGVIEYAGNCKMNFYTGMSSCKASGKIDEGQYNQAQYSMLAPGCCLVKREVVLKIKGFDRSFDPYGPEDRDFALRASRKRFKILYVPSAKIHHKGSKTPSEGKYNETYTKIKGRNMKLFMKRYATPLQWWCFCCMAPIIGIRTLFREARRNNTKAAIALFKSFLER